MDRLNGLMGTALEYLPDTGEYKLELDFFPGQSISIFL